MKKFLLSGFALILVAAVPHVASASSLSDEVVINDPNIYGNSDVVVAGGSDTTLIGGSPIYGGLGWGPLEVYILDPTSDLVNAHLFSTLSGPTASCSFGTGEDCIFLDSDATTDASIGVACPVAGECITADGTLQDVSGFVTSEGGAGGIFGGGTIGVLETEASASAPEPSSLILFGLGIAGLAWFRFNRSVRA